MALFACVLSTLGACDVEEQVGYPDDCVLSPDQFSPYYPAEDDSYLGYSGDDVVKLMNSPGVGMLLWHTGETTTVKLEATNVSPLAQVRDPPPFEGYCAPSIAIPDAYLAISSGDERLDFRIGTTISSRGKNGLLDTVWAVQHDYLPQQVPWLAVPEEWRNAQRSMERITLAVKTQGASQDSPFCLASDVVSDNPEAVCNDYDGTIVFHSVVPDVAVDELGPNDEFRAALAWWYWQ